MLETALYIGPFTPCAVLEHAVDELRSLRFDVESSRFGATPTTTPGWLESYHELRWELLETIDHPLCLDNHRLQARASDFLEQLRDFADAWRL